MCGTHYEAWRTRQHLYGRFESKFVDAGPVREHVEMLRKAGLGKRRIANLANVKADTVAHLRNARKGRPQPSARVLREVADAILAIAIPSTPFETAAPNRLVDATGTIRRLQALVAIGHPQNQLAERLGLTPGNFGRTLHTPQCTARRAREIAALFAELETVPGPSELARKRAARLGWPLPFQWDDDAIDDPDATPESVRRTRATALADRRTETAEQIEDLTAAGKSTKEIALQLGLSHRTIERRLKDRKSA